MPDAKPAYHTTMLHLSYINPDQTMYYMANPENNRKVVSGLQQKRLVKHITQLAGQSKTMGSQGSVNQ
jgi:hypothetical protein